MGFLIIVILLGIILTNYLQKRKTRVYDRSGREIYPIKKILIFSLFFLMLIFIIVTIIKGIVVVPPGFVYVKFNKITGGLKNLESGFHIIIPYFNAVFPDRLIYASKMSAKIDNTAIQDGYQLYHHSKLYAIKRLDNLFKI